MNQDIQKSREFYNEFFSSNQELTYDNKQRYEILFSLIDDLSLPSTSRVLDIGAGSGRIAKFLDSRFDQVVSLDIVVSNLLTEALEKTDNHCVEGALPYLPFRDNSFNLVVCSEVLEHIPEREAQHHSIEMLARVLDDGGYAVISTPNPRSPHSILKEWVYGFAGRIGMIEQSNCGQIIENWIPPNFLCETINTYFEIDEMKGSYYNVPGFGTGLEEKLRPVSDILTDADVASSYGLYQFYVGEVYG